LSHDEALLLLLETFQGIASQPEQTKQIANILLSMIWQMKTEDSSLPQGTLQLEALEHNTLGTNERKRKISNEIL